jgi:hypothetical protein
MKASEVQWLPMPHHSDSDATAGVLFSYPSDIGPGL